MIDQIGFIPAFQVIHWDPISQTGAKSLDWFAGSGTTCIRSNQDKEKDNNWKTPKFCSQNFWVTILEFSLFFWLYVWVQPFLRIDFWLIDFWWIYFSWILKKNIFWRRVSTQRLAGRWMDLWIVVNWLLVNWLLINWPLVNWLFMNIEESLLRGWRAGECLEEQSSWRPAPSQSTSILPILLIYGFKWQSTSILLFEILYIPIYPIHPYISHMDSALTVNKRPPITLIYGCQDRSIGVQSLPKTWPKSLGCYRYQSLEFVQDSTQRSPGGAEPLAIETHLCSKIVFMKWARGKFL